MSKTAKLECESEEEQIRFARPKGGFAPIRGWFISCTHNNPVHETGVHSRKKEKKPLPNQIKRYPATDLPLPDRKSKPCSAEAPPMGQPASAEGVDFVANPQSQVFFENLLS